MTLIIKCLALSSIILFFNLSTDASYNKLLYELFIFGCAGLCSIVSFFFWFVFLTFTYSTSSASSESLDDAS